MTALDVDRPRAHLRLARELYPEAWRQAEDFRRMRGKQLPLWPEWCYLPMAGAFAIVSHGGVLEHGREAHIGIIAALAAWRVSQGIYVYDSTLLDALWLTPIEGDIPTDVLKRLPEWCVYVATPGRRALGRDLAGFFAHLEWDSNTQREELRLVFDWTLADGTALLQPFPLHLVREGGLVASLGAVVDEALAQNIRAAEGRHPYLSPETVEQAREGLPAAVVALVAKPHAFAPFVSVLLYLCAQGAEIRDAGAGTPHPRRPPKRYPQAATRWDVGSRIGAAIRAGYAAQHEPNDSIGGTHASPRPHIRRAHWHSFWLGPHDNADQRRLELRWLPPIPVAVDDVDGDLVPTIHNVE